MKWVAGALYTVGLIAELAGFWILIDRAHVVDRRLKRMPVEKFKDADSYTQGMIIQQVIDRIDRETVVTGWPLWLILGGIVFGTAGNFVSLTS